VFDGTVVESPGNGYNRPDQWRSGAPPPPDPDPGPPDDVTTLVASTREPTSVETVPRGRVEGAVGRVHRKADTGPRVENPGLDGTEPGAARCSP